MDVELSGLLNLVEVFFFGGALYIVVIKSTKKPVLFHFTLRSSWNAVFCFSITPTSHSELLFFFLFTNISGLLSAEFIFYNKKNEEMSVATAAAAEKKRKKENKGKKRAGRSTRPFVLDARQRKHWKKLEGDVGSALVYQVFFSAD